MKISAGAGFLDIAPPAQNAGSGGSPAASGGDFGDIVRRVGEDHGESAAGKTARDQGKADEAYHADRAAKAAKDTAEAQKDRDRQKDAADKADAQPGPSSGPSTSSPSTSDVLGRLLGAAPGAATPVASAGHGAKAGKGADASAALAAAAASAGEGTTFDGALEERLVITPVASLSAGDKAEGDAGAKGKGGVALEVLHMETHFEPRADGFVIVEGASPADAASKGAKTGAKALDGVLSTIRSGSPTPRESVPGALAAAEKALPATGRASEDKTASVPMRFDEALARLATTQDGASSGTDGGERQGRRETSAGTRARPAEAAADDEGKVVSLRAAATPAAGVDDAVARTALPVASMTQQLAGRVIDAFRSGSGASQAADRASGATHLRLTAGGAALKTLTIQLQPENLGVLEVSMRLVDGNLSLEVAASEHATALALSHDRAGLKKLLEHAGFSLDEASISIVTRDATAAMARAAGANDAGGAAPGGQGGQGPSGGGSQDAAGERGGFGRETGSGGREAPARGGGGARGGTEVEAPERRRSSVFL